MVADKYKGYWVPRVEGKRCFDRKTELGQQWGIRIMAQSKTEKLQTLADELRTDDQHEFWIEYRPNRGWYAVATESRWFGDEGEYLGAVYKDARESLMSILG